jgi:glycosyltransferase involved in cell wall biosynthesis
MKNITKTLPANLLCFSHLRWDFVFQRPQHLLSRFAKYMKVYFIEEPVYDAESPYFSIDKKMKGLRVCTPHLPASLTKQETDALLTGFLDDFLSQKNLEDFAFWYYTAMALSFTDKFTPKLTIYDCMDELSAFKFAPEELKSLEKKLFQKADIVFTGGYSLYEAKKHLHANIHPFPSSIEKEHFLMARSIIKQPEDQEMIKGSKIGFYGVIDERFDIELIRVMASARPDWQFVLIGPIVKIDPESLPKNSNIHYTGQRSYQELPAYLAGWNAALIPFLLNESTRFISPTKTPEYLAAGIPVVSSAIRDVVKPYGVNKMVQIANTPADFISAIETALKQTAKEEWLKKVDKFLEGNSWDNTCMEMQQLIVKTLNSKNNISIAS